TVPGTRPSRTVRRAGGRWRSRLAPPPQPATAGRSLLLAPVRVGSAAGRIGDVRECVHRLAVAVIDAVAERQLVTHEEAADSLLLDVHDVVAEATAVREALVVAAEHAQTRDLARGRDRHGQVDTQLVGGRVAR